MPIRAWLRRSCTSTRRAQRSLRSVSRITSSARRSCRCGAQAGRDRHAGRPARTREGADGAVQVSVACVARAWSAHGPHRQDPAPRGTAARGSPMSAHQEERGRQVGEREARQVAEEAREAGWLQPSFGKQLFLGDFRLDLIHPGRQANPRKNAQTGDTTGRSARLTREPIPQTTGKPRSPGSVIGPPSDYWPNLVSDLSLLPVRRTAARPPSARPARSSPRRPAPRCTGSANSAPCVRRAR